MRALQLSAALALMYFCADHALNRLAFSDGWTILWPLNGITIALLLMRSRSDWPAMLLGVALGTGIGECMENNSMGFAALQRLISLTEVLLSASLLPPFETFETWLRRPSIFSRFVAALLAGPGVSGLIAAVAFHQARGTSYVASFSNWATADSLGIAATLPLALSFRSPEMWRLFRADTILRTTAVLALAVGSAGVIFSVSRYPLLFLLFPLLLLVETLLAFAGAAIAVFAIALVAVYTTTHALGPFGTWPANLAVSRDAALQLFLGFNLVALFPASILTMERRRMAAELIATNAQLTLLAATDALTGIANRRTLDHTFESEWKRATRLQTSLALLMVDIDHFKQFNDLYGHPAGDDCLKTVARTLRNNVRRSGDLAARFGGEEFALLLPHTSLLDACGLGEKIRQSVAALSIRHEGSPRGCVTVSIGCSAATPFLGEDRMQLLQSADAALYLAKQGGRNCVQVSSPATGEIEDLKTVSL